MAVMTHHLYPAFIVVWEVIFDHKSSQDACSPSSGDGLNQCKTIQFFLAFMTTTYENLLLHPVHAKYTV